MHALCMRLRVCIVQLAYEPARLQRCEDELREMKSIVKGLAPGPQQKDDRARPSRDSSLSNYASTLHAADRSPGYFSVPADKGAQSAPIAVLRSISQQITRGCRRLLGHINVDLVQLQLLDEQTANELIQLCVSGVLSIRVVELSPGISSIALTRGQLLPPPRPQPLRLWD